MSDDAADDMIPKSRLDQEIRKTTAANARVLELEAELAQVAPRAQQAETLTSTLEDARAALEAERAARREDQTIFGAGLTDPDLVRFEHGRLPEEERPELGEWLARLKSQPDAAPVSLRPFLGGAEESVEESAEEPRSRRGTVRSQGATRGDSTGGGMGKKEREVALARAYKKAQEGDFAEWRKLRGFDA